MSDRTIRTPLIVLIACIAIFAGIFLWLNTARLEPVVELKPPAEALNSTRPVARVANSSPLTERHSPSAVRHWIIADRSAPVESKAIPDELIVTLRRGDSMDALAQKYGATVAGHLAVGNTYRLKFPDAEQAAVARHALASEPSVASLDSNYAIARPQIPLPVASDEAAPVSLNLQPIDADHPVVIGLVDTAVGASGSGADAFLLGSAVAMDTPTHATAVLAAIIDGLSSSIGARAASSVRVVPVDVYGGAEDTTSYQVAEGILSAMEQGASIINLSLGTTEPVQMLQDIIAAGDELGVVFVGAAGNEPVASPTYPAAYDPVLAVTSMDESGRVTSGVNYGSFVDAGAPGSIRFPFGTQAYISSGTSISAGFISGLTAGLAERSGISVAEAADRVAGMMKVDTGQGSK